MVDKKFFEEKKMSTETVAHFRVKSIYYMTEKVIPSITKGNCQVSRGKKKLFQPAA